MSYYLYAICKRLAFNHYLIGLNAASFSNAFSIAFICLTICDESRLLPQYRRLARICLISLCVVYFGFYLVRLEQYSQTLCLIDHFEPSAITISWLWGRGGECPQHRRGGTIRVSIWPHNVHERLAFPRRIRPKHSRREAIRCFALAGQRRAHILDRKTRDFALSREHKHHLLPARLPPARR